MILSIGKGSVNNPSPRGFTLTELVVVIGIVLVFLAISVPVFRSAYQDSLLKNATRELANSLSYARDLAVLEGVNYEVNFNFAENKYTIAPVSEKYSPMDAFVKVPRSLARTSYYRYLPEKINFSRMISNKIIFYPNGSSQDFFIYLQNNKNAIYTVMIRGVYSQIKTFNFYYTEQPR